MNRSKSLAAKKWGDSTERSRSTSSLKRPTVLKKAPKLSSMMFAPTNTLTEEIDKQREEARILAEIKARQNEPMPAKSANVNEYTEEEKEDQVGELSTSGNMNTIMERIEKKLDSAQRKFLPAFG